MGLYSNLNLNFDETKFGNALDPRGTIPELVTITTPPITKWQYDALTANNVSRTLYLKNPLANVTNTIAVTANAIYVIVNTYSILSNANSASANLVSSANAFFRHTQRLSGLEVTANSALPDFFSATSYGRSVFPILAKFEGVANNTPILGSMTSLFIENDLVKYSIDLSAAQIELQNSLVASGLPPSYSSNLSSTRLTQIVNLLNDTSNLMSTRIQHDINFFGKIVQLSNNYFEISRYSGFGDIESYLVENYVGTQTLIDKL